MVSCSFVHLCCVIWCFKPSLYPPFILKKWFSNLYISTAVNSRGLHDSPWADSPCNLNAEQRRTQSFYSRDCFEFYQKMMSWHSRGHLGRQIHNCAMGRHCIATAWMEREKVFVELKYHNSCKCCISKTAGETSGHFSGIRSPYVILSVLWWRGTMY